MSVDTQDPKTRTWQTIMAGKPPKSDSVVEDQLEPAPPAARRPTDVTHVRKVVQHVKWEIAKGNLRPGALLVEASLAKELGLSRQPVREALAVLDNEGLVERLPRFGSRVRETTSDEVREILTARALMEGLVASELAGMPDSRRAGCVKQIDMNLDKARGMLDKAAAADSRGDEAGVRDAAAEFCIGDGDFHAELASLAGFRLWGTIAKQFRHKLVIHNLRALPSISFMKCILDEHAAIRDAIERADREAAKVASFRHLNAVAARYFPAVAAPLAGLREFVGLRADDALVTPERHPPARANRHTGKQARAAR